MMTLTYPPPEIKSVAGKKLAGIKMQMSLVNYRVAELWKQFLPRRKEIANVMTTDLISMSVYSNDYFKNFRPENNFEKWAACEVENYSAMPDGFEKIEIPSGLYAVFHYKGLNTDNSIFQYIFNQWLPQSGYELDDRPHFEILGEKYRNIDPSSEEDIFVPVKKV